VTIVVEEPSLRSTGSVRKSPKPGCDTPSVITSPDEYLATVPGVGRPWLREFWDYVQNTYPDLEVTMFRQRPMYKFGHSYQHGYVMFTAAKTHFAVHAIDFDLVARARSTIPGALGGKGNVAVKYTATEAKPALKAFVDAVMSRHDVGRRT
jgi:hypothetical protein